MAEKKKDEDVEMGEKQEETEEQKVARQKKEAFQLLISGMYICYYIDPCRSHFKHSIGTTSGETK
jgi:hypothetical protein